MAWRIGFVVATPLCLHVLHNYEQSRKLPGMHELDSASATAHTSAQVKRRVSREERLVANMIQVTSGPPAWLAHPDPLLLLAAALSAGYLFASYYQLNAEDEMQPWIIGAGFLVSIVVSLLGEYSVLTIGLTIVPWTLFISLIASDALHLGTRLRAHRMPQGIFDEEDQQMRERKNKSSGEELRN